MSKIKYLFNSELALMDFVSFNCQDDTMKKFWIIAFGFSNTLFPYLIPSVRPSTSLRDRITDNSVLLSLSWTVIVIFDLIPKTGRHHAAALGTSISKGKSKITSSGG